MASRQVLIRPVVTEKATQITDSHAAGGKSSGRRGKSKAAAAGDSPTAAGPTYTFEVAVEANKHQIRQAVEGQFTVAVARVHTLILPGKARRRGARVYRRPARKKAMVQLRAGHTIDLFAQEG